MSKHSDRETRTTLGLGNARDYGLDVSMGLPSFSFRVYIRLLGNNDGGAEVESVSNLMG